MLVVTDMFADPPFPGLPLLLVAIPTWVMVLVFLVMECTKVKDSCAMDTAEKETVADDKVASA